MLVEIGQCVIVFQGVSWFDFILFFTTKAVTSYEFNKELMISFWHSTYYAEITLTG